jgi:tripartite-type tricarboxylate transporter receptor subunit TctC
MRVSDFFDRSSLSPVRKIFESLGRLDIAGPTDRAGEDAKALARLNAEVNAIVNTAEVKQQLVNLGVNPIGRGSLDELQAFVKAEVISWGKVVQEAGLAS